MASSLLTTDKRCEMPIPLARATRFHLPRRFEFRPRLDAQGLCIVARGDSGDACYFCFKITNISFFNHRFVVVLGGW